MGEVIIAVQDLHHTYLKGTPLARAALRGAHLTVKRGEIAALVGASGAGKTTLLHFLNGLLIPERRGCVAILGQDTADPQTDLDALRRRVGLVFQEAHQQLLERFVGDDVAYGPRQMGLERAEVRARVYEALEAVGLDPEAFVDRHTFSLSGGEMRRVALAGVLAMRPEVLLLDEATAGLDPRGRREVHRLLRSLRDERGMTIVFASNDMEEVATLADSVTVLKEGQTVLEGAPSEVLAQPERLRLFGLAEPPTVRLAWALKRAGFPLEGEPLRPHELVEAIWQGLKG